jgi:hypothetical protein
VFAAAVLLDVAWLFSRRHMSAAAQCCGALVCLAMRQRVRFGAARC